VTERIQSFLNGGQRLLNSGDKHFSPLQERYSTVRAVGPGHKCMICVKTTSHKTLFLLDL